MIIQQINHLFVGIDNLKVDDERKIRGMLSENGEFVPFSTIIDPILCKGQFESWVAKLEEAMIKSVNQIIESAIKDYPLKIK